MNRAELNEPENDHFGKALPTVPFESIVSLKPLIQYWLEATEEGNEIDGLLALRVREQLAAHPSLLSPIDHIDSLRSHRSLIDVLMSAVFPPALREEIMGAALAPNLTDPIYYTPPYEKLMYLYGKEFLTTYTYDHQNSFNNQLLFACNLILKKKYKIDAFKEAPIFLHLKEPDKNFHRYYKSSLHTRFLSLNSRENGHMLKDKDLHRLLQYPDDVNLWRETLRPETYSIEGLVFLHLMEMSEEETLSGLTYDLLSRDALITEGRRQALLLRLRNLVRVPDLQFGIQLLSSCPMFHQATEDSLWKGLNLTKRLFPEELLEVEALSPLKNGKIVVLSDLENMPLQHPYFRQLQSKGYQNLVLAPLQSTDGLIGLLELGSGYKHAISHINSLKIRELLPVFALALERSLVECENRIQAYIQETYTHIHSSVAWKFRESAISAISGGSKVPQKPDEIIFKHVYPLYGVSDIRSSTMVRNHAIQSDLVQQLSLAQQVLNESQVLHPLPLVEKLNYKIEGYKKNIEDTLHSGDEISILELIREELDPLFLHLRTNYPDLEKIISLYENTLEPEMGFVYKRRKDYEESVQQINSLLSKLIEEKQEEAQDIFPHFFSKTLTDGIEYNMYIGSSIRPDLPFDPLHLQHLRLWQIITTCELARRAAQLKSQLAVSMDLAHLILVHNSPLSIGFKMDEKQFDVDGSFNVQYEIIKKRIDKAYVTDSYERVTQPGKLSIVYTHERDAEEYLTYIHYLCEKEYLEEKIEYLDIEPMQGVQGLKALRVPINLYTPVLHAEPTVKGLFKQNN
ncbi:MAG: hypothetical protein AAFR66_18295 [Bacteroidota bacterium]